VFYVYLKQKGEGKKERNLHTVRKRMLNKNGKKEREQLTSGQTREVDTTQEQNKS